MRIVIDLQGAQTDSRLRGIGRYSLNFAKALIRNRGNDTIIVALNALFPDTIGPIRAALEGLLPVEHIAVWDAPGPVAERDPTNQSRRDAAELIREAFLTSLNPDIVHVTSLFEGYVDDAVTSIGRHDVGTPVTVTLYDLIPLLNRDEYLESNIDYANHYLRKIGHLARAHALLAISHSAKKEAIDNLACDPKRVTAVGTGSDGRFEKVSLSTEDERAIRTRFGLDLPFLMYVSAPEVHKNHRRLIEAYSKVPAAVRQAHRLALVGRFSENDRSAFDEHARRCGLPRRELVIISGVTDEQLNALYNIAKGFVIPSWHEGFGLPAVEAMQCGRAVIGSRASSLPEVIGREDALFDAFDTLDMARAMTRLAIDDAWRAELEMHAISQATAFDWDCVARRALEVMRNLHASSVKAAPAAPTRRRPRLAFVSPLPPARSGISDYSAALLPELAVYYDINVIVEQDIVSDRFIVANFPIRSTKWFLEHANEFERIVYQFGNSPLHEHMFRLLEEHPGVVVLHDFFLSAVQAGRRLSDPSGEPFIEALEMSHGYSAIPYIDDHGSLADTIRSYPMNLPVLQDALGIVVHSQHARRLIRDWYGPSRACDSWVVPLLRSVQNGSTRETARAELGIGPEDLVVCSFGFLDPVKLNDRLLESWINSNLSRQMHAKLIFVGENHGLDYGKGLANRISESCRSDSVEITGWIDPGKYHQYLAAADIGVQLRANSRGEMSASVLDCMNYGIATVVNAHGAMAELDPTSVSMLSDDFTEEELASALTILAEGRDLRVALGRRAQLYVRKQHAPPLCAQQYAAAIEKAYARADRGLYGLTRRLRGLKVLDADASSVATVLAKNFPPLPRPRQLLVDVSSLARADLRSGIERVVRSILSEWLRNPPRGWSVAPVYADSPSNGYRYARQFTYAMLGMKELPTREAMVEAWSGDVFVGLDFQPYAVIDHKEYLESLHNRGVGVWFLLYDLLPVSMPQFFPDGAGLVHQRWLETISAFDGVLCISKAVANEFSSWLEERRAQRRQSLRIEWYHNGADIERSLPTKGLPQDAPKVLEALGERPSFLMVGTIEPRKGHLQAIAACERLWRDGVELNLVIVGAEGWKPLPDADRRTIPLIVDTIRKHNECGLRLFWLDGISDEFLEKLYGGATCLIAASEGEGFGLPLIEAAQHELPILARDIPVFREVAGDHALYFAGLEPDDLAEAIRTWIDRHAEGNVPRSSAIRWRTWAESAADVLKLVGVGASREENDG